MSKEQTLKVGCWIAAAMRESTGDLDAYFGEIDAVDEHGTLIDWVDGRVGWGMFIPWGDLQRTQILNVRP